MAQGLGFIEFSTGDVLSAAAANGYLASQSVMVFASAAARTSAITTPYEGMVSYLKDTDVIQYYSGSAWVTVGASSSSAVGCILYNTANYTISNATDTILTFNTEILDTDGFHSTVTNTGRITIPAGKAGKYYVFAWGSYANNTTGYRQLEILVNGRTGTPSRVGNDSASSANNMGLNPVGAAVLAVGDYIEVNTYQNSGGSLTFYGGAADVQFGALYLGA